MAIWGSIKVEGFKEFQRSARQAGLDLEELKAVNAAAGQIVLSQAHMWSPKESKSLDNTLKRMAAKKQARLTGGNRRGAGKKGATPIGAVPYAPPIHWGWRDRGIKPNPFLSYSAQATELKWFALYHDYWVKALLQIHGA